MAVRVRFPLRYSTTRPEFLMFGTPAAHIFSAGTACRPQRGVHSSDGIPSRPIQATISSSASGGEPADGRIAPEPRELPLGIAPRVALDPLDGLLVARAAVEPVEQLPVTHRLQGVQFPERVERPGFVHQPVGEHPLHPSVDPFVKRPARKVHSDFHDPERPLAPLAAPQFRVGASALQTDLQRPDHARRIAAVHRLPNRPDPVPGAPLRAAPAPSSRNRRISSARSASSAVGRSSMPSHNACT